MTNANANTSKLQYVGRVSNQSCRILTSGQVMVEFDITGENGEVTHYKRKVCELLGDGDSNTKLRKNGRQTSWVSYGLSLAPSQEAGIGNLCPHAGACAAACLDHSGLGGVFASIHLARISKTIAFQLQRDWFIARLTRELENRVKRSKNKRKPICVRLNVFSDIPWERMYAELFARFPRIQFYDYTKNPRRVGQLLPNYYVTFSRDETNELKALEHLKNGNNASIVFDVKRNGALPALYRGFPVIDGDVTDLRFTDPAGVWIGLKFKGTNADRAAAIESGFCVVVN